MNEASSVQFFGSQEHRIQVSRAIKESLSGKTIKVESPSSGQTIGRQTAQIKWEMPARDILEACNDAAEYKHPQLQNNSHDFHAHLKFQLAHAQGRQSRLPQDNPSTAQPSLTPLSPPPSHSQSPRSLQSAHFESAQRQAWPPSPHTPLSPFPTLPGCTPSPERSLRPQHGVAHPLLPAMRDPPHTSIEWQRLPEHPAGASTEETMALMDGEIALYEMRGQYEESVARGLLARYHALLARQQREVLMLRARIEARWKGGLERRVGEAGG